MAQKRTPRIDLNPSSADRWTTCTASPGYIMQNWDKVPAQDTSFSQEGTTAHEVASAILQGRKPDEKNKYACPTPIDRNMHWHGWNYAEYVNSLIEPGGKLLVEQKLPLFYAEARNAIVDAAVINPASMHVVDYKYGEGVTVSPERSLQATIYARCVLWSNPPTDNSFPITIHIYQPRGRSSHDAPFHVWETTWGEIWEMSKLIFKTAVNILHVTDPINPKANDLVFAPSEKACQFCPARGFCTERPKQLLTKIDALPDTPNDLSKSLPPVQSVSVNQLSAILTHGEQIIKWLKDGQSYALERMKTGVQIPGFKLVTSRGGNRYWSNPEKAAKLLIGSTVLKEDEVYERSVISPAAAEKLVGKNKFNVALTNLISKPPGQPVIAPDTDSREGCFVNAASEFKAITDINEF